DISIEMAADFILAADRFQLSLFAPLLLYGLRPGELGWLFAEHIEADWLSVASIPELDYSTKGRRDKRFPLTPCLRSLWDSEGQMRPGLIYVNRPAAEGLQKPSLWGLSLAGL